MKLQWPIKIESAESIRQKAMAEVMTTVLEQRGLLDQPQMLPPQAFAGGPPPRPLADSFAWDNPWQFVVPQSPKRAPGKKVDITTLREIADMYDPLRACIEHLKRELKATPIKFVGKDPKANVDSAVAEVNHWFSKEGGLGGFGVRRKHFEVSIIEDALVVGACAIVNVRNLGGGLHSNMAIDAATIRPRVDGFGWVDPAFAYEQWIMGSQAAAFSQDDLTYDGIHARSYTPYFCSPVEWLLLSIMAAMKADEWNLSWLTDGDTVTDAYAMPEGWSVDQIKAFYALHQAMHSGDPRSRQKTKFYPSGSQKIMTGTRKDNDFQAFMIWLVRRVCSIMGVNPASIGYSGEQYKVSQEDAMDQTSAFGVGELLAFRKDLYDDMIADLGFPEIETRNVTAKEEDANKRTERLVQAAGGAYYSINDSRSEDGMDPVEGGDVIRGLSDPDSDRDMTGAPAKDEDRLDRRKAKTKADQEADAKRKRIRNALLMLFGLALLGAEESVEAAVQDYLQNPSHAPFSTSMGSALAPHYHQAASIGTQLSGKADSGVASQVAVAVLEQQSGFLQSFEADLSGGKYQLDNGPDIDSVAVLARAKLYVARMRGVLQEAWAKSLPAGAVVAWVLGGCNHCADCPRIASEGPYTIGTLPSYPGDGSTECGNHCCCGLKLEDGTASVLPDDDLSGDPSAPDTLGERVDLAKWERKALASLKAGNGSCVPFHSEFIPEFAHANIMSALKGATDPKSVRAIFRGMEK